MANGKKTSSTINDAIVEPLQAAGEAMKEAGAKAAANTSLITSTVIEQAEANTREAFAAMRAVASATNITEILKIQGDFVRDQGNRGMANARQIGELIAQFGRDAVNSISKKD